MARYAPCIGITCSIAPTYKMHDFQHIAITQRHCTQFRARRDYAIALHRNFLRLQIQLAHQIGHCAGGGAAAFAVDGNRVVLAHAKRDSGQRASDKCGRKLRMWPSDTKATPMIVRTASSIPCGAASAPPMKESPIIATTNGARRR